MGEKKVLTGNEACTLGAIAAGMNFFAGYPITPATEIAELSSELLPKVGGKYMQMEDELASIGAVIGASFAGAKSMTATSGPGFSLMQENLGYGVVAEVPCVIVDVMRQGPNQGVATVPAQGDLFQSAYGSHGDRPVIALAPNSVAETYTETVRAFNLAQKYRTPVVLLSDATLAHMSELVDIPDKVELVDRKRPTCPPEEYQPCMDDGTGIPPMAVLGDGYRWYISGILHTENGFPTTKSEVIQKEVTRLCDKVRKNADDIMKWEEYRVDDAELILVSLGLVSRCAKAAVDEAREAGLKVGLFRPITLWPFPEKRMRELSEGGANFLTCEMNEGQLNFIVRAAVKGGSEVYSLTQNNGRIISDAAILGKIKEVL